MQPQTAEDQARAEQLVVAVAAAMNALSDEITRSIHSVLAEIEGLEDQRLLDLLAASIEANVETILHVLQHDIPAENIEPPSAAYEYARRLAQHGVPVNSLVRAYRLGQDQLMKWSFEEIARQGADAEIALAASQHIVSRTFDYIDWISQRVVTVYEAEREVWLENRSTVRAHRIRELVDGRELDLAAAETAIGYSLRQQHIGVIAWVPDESPPAGALADLEQVVAALGRELSDGRRPLFAPSDRSSGWAWLPLGASSPPPAPATIGRQLAEAPGTVMLALGRPAAGVTGFRDTHREALLAQRVALVAGPDAARVTSYGDPDVRAAAGLCTDLEHTRMLVRTTLGGLARADANHERLRETLLTFLSTSRSYTQTAELLSLHKNSVKYRVAKAEEARGAPVGEDRLDVELALIACRLLKRAVLPATTE